MTFCVSNIINIFQLFFRSPLIQICLLKFERLQYSICSILIYYGTKRQKKIIRNIKTKIVVSWTRNITQYKCFEEIFLDYIYVYILYIFCIVNCKKKLYEAYLYKRTFSPLICSKLCKDI